MLTVLWRPSRVKGSHIHASTHTHTQTQKQQQTHKYRMVGTVTNWRKAQQTHTKLNTNRREAQTRARAQTQTQTQTAIVNVSWAFTFVFSLGSQSHYLTNEWCELGFVCFLICSFVRFVCFQTKTTTGTPIKISQCWRNDQSGILISSIFYCKIKCHRDNHL